jgi:amino acid transporter
MTSELTTLVKEMGLGEAVVTVFDKLADRLGITVQTIYMIIVNAQRTIALVQISFILIWIASILITAGFMVYRRNKKDKTDWELDDYAPLLITLLIVGAIMAFILVFLYEPVIALLCPEYAALKEMLAVFSNI